MTETENRIIDFSVYNRYTPDDEIVGIGLALCEKYGWDTDEITRQKSIFNVSRNKHKAWEYTIKAAREHKDVWAIATVLFLKEHSPVIEENVYAITSEHLLVEMIELLAEIEDKDAFTHFLVGRACFNGRGAELDLELAAESFKLAAEGGFEIAELFALEIEGELEQIFSVSSKLMEKLPDSHVVRYYLGLCYYHGYGTEVDHKKVIELLGYTADTESYNNDPIDYYFLCSRYLVGLCYFHGYGVKKDLRRAQELFRLSAAKYNPEAWYAEAITMLISDKEKNPIYIWYLLEKSALRGYLPAARKVMLCLRCGYGVDRDEKLYSQYVEYYEHEKVGGKTVSDLGYEADHCDLVKRDGGAIKDDETD